MDRRRDSSFMRVRAEAHSPQHQRAAGQGPDRKNRYPWNGRSRAGNNDTVRLAGSRTKLRTGMSTDSATFGAAGACCGRQEVRLVEGRGSSVERFRRPCRAHHDAMRAPTSEDALFVRFAATHLQSSLPTSHSLTAQVGYISRPFDSLAIKRHQSACGDSIRRNSASRVAQRTFHLTVKEPSHSHLVHIKSINILSVSMISCPKLLARTYASKTRSPFA